MWLLAASLLLARPVPMEMPRAESFIVKEAGKYRLEDRYAASDLWALRTILTSGYDADGRFFSLARLETELPSVAGPLTRMGFAEAVMPIGRRDSAARRAAMSALAPVPLADKAVRPHVGVRGYDDVLYWQGTNSTMMLCQFRPEKSEQWYFAVWELLEGDEPDRQRQVFEEEFLGRDFSAIAAFPTWRQFRTYSEAQALRLDAHDTVTNCPDWHWTDAGPYVVLDDLVSSRQTVVAITNELPRLYADFVAALPTPLESTNITSVIRIFGDRRDFEAAVDESVRWAAAYWSPARREIVAWLPRSGIRDLVRTFRHEAFHQYLSYAVAMIPASPWFNEGYAEYFESPKECGWELPFAPEVAMPLLPRLFESDYEGFYAQSEEDRKINYALAKSVIVFVEKGMREVRNDPFRDFKRNYLETLVATRDMLKATESAFGNADMRNRFIYEWSRFWKNMSAD